MPPPALWTAVGLLLIFASVKVTAGRARRLQELVELRTRELNEANQALRRQSLTGPLTGLSNRRLFEFTIGDLTKRILDRTKIPFDRRDQRTRNRHICFSSSTWINSKLLTTGSGTAPGIRF